MMELAAEVARQILLPSRHFPVFFGGNAGSFSPVKTSLKSFQLTFPLVTAFTLWATAWTAGAANVVTIGDSLTAEYDVIPAIPGFDDLPTDYAKVTVDGWEAMSWVEVAGRLRAGYFNFGGWKALSNPWSVPRLSGYEYNWAIPGVDAGQYEQFVTSSFLSNPLYYAGRQPLEDQLSNKAQRVVIWLGGNDFRANYGRFYDGGSSQSFIDGLIDDVGRVVDFVRANASNAQIVVGNFPDLGATPTKKAAHPDPVKRARVSAVTEAANMRLAQMAAKKHVVIADMYSTTAALVRDEPLYFGGVRITNAKDADNNPQFAFTRDGLHPNTALQILNVRSVIRAFNQGYNGGIPNITDSEALGLLGIDPDQPFYDWLKRVGLSDRSFQADGDHDGVSQLAEFALGLDPRIADAQNVPVKMGGRVPGVSGNVSVHVSPRKVLAQYVTVRLQYSADGATWNGLPPERLLAFPDGSFTGVLPPGGEGAHLQLRVVTIPPYGSGARNTSYVPIR